MKIRQKQIWAKGARGFALALASLIAFSCDQPQIAVEPDESAAQIFVISHDADSVSVLGFGVTGRSGNTLESDSAFEVTYERFENIAGPNFLTEIFDVSLIHKLQGDTTLDYGIAMFGGSQLSQTRNSMNPIGTIYNNHSTLVNLTSDGGFPAWSDSYRLKTPLAFSATNSPDIKDFVQEIPTQEPNWIIGPTTGQTIGAANDLEITFRREINKGSTITIGCLGSGSYYHFEILNSALKVTIPAKYIQMIKDTVADAVYQVAFEEQLQVGSLASENKFSGERYAVPILENSIGGIVIKLEE
jgi:hypothetical protein